MDNTGTIKVYREWKWSHEYPPTRKCLVCERIENPNATIVNSGAAWLCPECKSRIKKLIYKEEKT